LIKFILMGLTFLSLLAACGCSKGRPVFLAGASAVKITPEEEFGADKFRYERTRSLGPRTGTIILEAALELLGEGSHPRQ